MITIEYAGNGFAVNDFLAEQWLRDLLSWDPARDHHSVISSSLPIALVREAIAKGNLSHDKVTFVFEGRSFQANEYGSIPDWPRGFCDKEIACSERILRAAMDRRRAATGEIRVGRLRQQASIEPPSIPPSCQKP